MPVACGWLPQTQSKYTVTGAEKMQRQRINRFDNLKGMLIIGVVLVHVLSRVQYLKHELQLPDYLFSVLVCFIMPAFTFMSGLFSSKKWAQDESIEKIISTIFLPFVVFHLLQWAIFSRQLRDVFYPSYTTWYLLSLFFWRLLVIPFSKLRFSFPLSIIAALICGFTPADDMLEVARTVCFFPFFLAGYYADKGKIAKLGSSRVQKALAAGVLAMVLVLVIFLHAKGLPTVQRVFYERYESLGLSNIYGLLLRALAICIGFISTGCLICLMPEKNSFLSALGRNTMPVYVGHPFIIRTYAAILAKAGIFAEISEAGFLVFAAVATCAICLLLGNRYAVAGYQKLMDFVSRIFLIKKQPQSLQLNQK